MKFLTQLLDTESKWYETGKPCKYGHIAPRLKSNRTCKECLYKSREKYEDSDAYKTWKQENKAAVAAAWQKRNKGYVNSVTRKRQAAKLQRTPNWLTEEQIIHMRCLYQVAAMRSKDSDQEWHVDHIVPLQGKLVCGLHVPWNLRVIPAVENMKKNNRYNQDYEEETYEIYDDIVGY